MKTIKLEKNSGLIDLKEIMHFDKKTVRNEIGKSYAYCARLTDYVKTDKINKEYFNEIEFKVKDDSWSFSIGKVRLNLMQKDEIYEFKINVRKSGNYSYLEKSYAKVISNNDLEIEFMVFNTAFKAFSSFK